MDSEFMLRSCVRAGLKREFAFSIAPSRGRTRSFTAVLSPTPTSALLSPPPQAQERRKRALQAPAAPGSRPLPGRNPAGSAASRRGGLGAAGDAAPPGHPLHARHQIPSARYHQHARPLHQAQAQAQTGASRGEPPAPAQRSRRGRACNHAPPLHQVAVGQGQATRRCARPRRVRHHHRQRPAQGGPAGGGPEEPQELLATGLLDGQRVKYIMKKGKETSKPAPALPDDLLEEIFLRLPPDEPEWLMRSSLASKLWFGLLSGPSFRGRYLELHGAPPMLGYLYMVNREEPYPARLNFVPTTKFRPRIPDGGWRRDWYYEALDCRHGRVLLGTDDEVVPVASHSARILLGTAAETVPEALIIWNPMTGYQRELDKPDPDRYMMYQAAVLCAASGCDHRTCHEGPFRVVFFGVDGVVDGDDYYAYVMVFSSETGQWSEPCSSLHLEAEPCHTSGPAPHVLIEDTLYFKFAIGEDLGILKYDLGSDCLSVIDVPVAGLESDSEAILMAMEDGSLGFALMDELSLHVWSRKMGSNRVTSWTKRRTIDLENLSPMKDLGLKGHVEGSDIVLMTTDLGVYEFDLKSLRLKKLCNREEDSAYLIPYTSFYHPQGGLKDSDGLVLPLHVVFRFECRKKGQGHAVIFSTRREAWPPSGARVGLEMGDGTSGWFEVRSVTISDARMAKHMLSTTLIAVVVVLSL